MAKPVPSDRMEPTWPDVHEGKYAVSELAAPVAGALSPFGEVEFPLPQDKLPYRHPVTRINR
ncbi:MULTISPECIES: hypothetical protein [Actinoalloteichus]|uniref:Uncharacterized protein n=1 Tax=Actinoalloteichus caeruleus DSM 43889 TaxID=1120930 RepID=A0ABT1JK76_ACTCY|nr:hypothetical protein [Actinoalloteichus caeruleus]MCP2332566.1 hypothetical protein [Actinoalloteichus caeruleus DSM 43889]